MTLYQSSPSSTKTGCSQSSLKPTSITEPMEDRFRLNREKASSESNDTIVNQTTHGQFHDSLRLGGEIGHFQKAIFFVGLTLLAFECISAEDQGRAFVCDWPEKATAEIRATRQSEVTHARRGALRLPPGFRSLDHQRHPSLNQWILFLPCPRPLRSSRQVLMRFQCVSVRGQTSTTP